MKSTKKRVGNNPTGKNQYDNVRAKKPISVRLLKDQDSMLRAIADKNNKTISQLLDEAVGDYLLGHILDA